MTLSAKKAFTWFQSTMDGPVATVQVTTPGLHTIGIYMREDGLRVDRLLLTTASTAPTGTGPPESPLGPPGSPTPTPTPTVAPTPGPNTYVEQGGRVVMEAETYASAIARSGDSWLLRSDRAGFVAAGFMSSEPDNGSVIDAGFATTSPELQYRVNFTTPGTYHVWLRGYSTNLANDSVHVGVDGQALASADRMTLPDRNSLPGSPAPWTGQLRRS